MNKQEYYEKPK